MKKIFTLFAVLSMIILSSCSKETLYNDYVQLSRISYTFDYNDETELEITVTTNNNAAWQVSAEKGEWLIYSTDADRLIVKATDNETAQERTAVLTVTSGDAKAEILLNQMPYGFYGNYMDTPPTSLGGYSRNGQYLGYVNPYRNDKKELIYECRVINTETMEEVKYEVPDVISDNGTNTNIPYDEIHCISNDGRTIMFFHGMQARSLIRKDGKEVKMTLPEGYNTPRPEFFNADASVVVGYCKTADKDRMTVPVVWRDGKAEFPEIPEFLQDGTPMPRQGVIPRGCSDDGSVIYGSEWKHYGLIYWKNGKMVDIGAKYAEVEKEGKITTVKTIQTTATYRNISPNGKFIACAYNATGGNSVGATFYPVVVNTETGEATIYKEYTGFIGIHAMNDGTIFVQQQAASSGYSVIDYKTSKLKNLTEWTAERYGINLPDTRFVEWITSDETVIFGKRYYYSGMGTLKPTWFLRR